jgi:hypothetical protein
MIGYVRGNPILARVLAIWKNFRILILFSVPSAILAYIGLPNTKQNYFFFNPCTDRKIFGDMVFCP